MSNQRTLSSAVDEYISLAPAENHERLQAVRQFVLETAPEAEELIRSGIPSYTLYGRPFMYFASQNGYIGFYVDAKVVEVMAEKLKGFKGSKAGIQLPNDKPLPLDLMKEMLALRIADLQAMPKKKK